MKKIITYALALLLSAQLFVIYAGAAIGSFKITFDPNYDGAVSVSMTVGSGDHAAEIMPEDPIRIGFGFNGWYLEKECINEFDVNAPLSGDLTVYACWRRPLEYCDAKGNVFVCEKYKEITPKMTRFNCGEDSFISFADGCAETGSISLSGEVTYKLILKDGQSVNAYDILLGNGTSIEIYGQTQGDGELSLSTDNVAIGALRETVCGNITINGGVITARTFSDACIGTSESRSDIFGAYPSGCGDITINGGTIIAESTEGACIGSGFAEEYNSYVGNITVNGGRLDLTNHSGACIGTGSAYHGKASCGNITVNGGNITMRTHVSSAIGVGDNQKGYTVCGDLSITGGTVSAESYFGHFVGGVNDLSISGGTVTGSTETFGAVAVNDTIRITGGNVTLTGNSSYSFKLVECNEFVAGDGIVILCGDSALDCVKADRADLPQIKYVKAVSVNEICDEYEFSTTNDSFTAKNKEDGSTLVMRLPNAGYCYDGEAHGPQFDNAEKLEWIDKTGMCPSVRYYLADGVTPTDKENSGASSDGNLPSRSGTYVVRAEFETVNETLALSVRFHIVEKVPVPFSRTEITIGVGETDDSVTYSGPIAQYLEVFDLSDYDVIDAKADHNGQKLYITGKSVGTSEIYLEPISVYGFDDVEFVIPVITVHVTDGSPVKQTGNAPAPGQAAKTNNDNPDVNAQTGDDMTVRLLAFATSIIGVTVCFVLIGRKRKAK